MRRSACFKNQMVCFKDQESTVHTVCISDKKLCLDLPQFHFKSSKDAFLSQSVVSFLKMDVLYSHEHCNRSSHKMYQGCMLHPPPPSLFMENMQGVGNMVVHSVQLYKHMYRTAPSKRPWALTAQAPKI